MRDNAAALGLPGAPARTIIGMAFDPVGALWVTDNYEYVGPLNVPDWSGRIGRLTGPDHGTYTPMVVNLPRSVKDHETNSLAFGPDGALYVTQGANNAMGAPDSTWGNRPERLLSAAILRLDPTRLPATRPLDARTADGGGAYDPYAASAPLTIHATGVRKRLRPGVAPQRPPVRTDQRLGGRWQHPRRRCRRRAPGAGTRARWCHR